MIDTLTPKSQIFKDEFLEEVIQQEYLTLNPPRMLKICRLLNYPRGRVEVGRRGL